MLPHTHFPPAHFPPTNKQNVGTVESHVADYQRIIDNLQGEVRPDLDQNAQLYAFPNLDSTCTSNPDLDLNSTCTLLPPPPQI